MLTLGIFGFVALLALAGAGVVGWLVTRLSERVTALEKQNRTLALECRTLHQRMDLLPPVPPAEAAPPAMPINLTIETGMNLNKRVQILRLNRRGESPAHIASVLHLPLAQVELVLKLQRQEAEGPLPSQQAG